VIKQTDIPNDTITYAKMQNAVADNVVIGNILGAGEAFQELASSDIYSLVSSDITSNLVIDEDDMASDSDTKVPTQQSVKAYVDANVVQPDVVLIDTQTASSSASITFTDLDSTYERYAVHISNIIPATNISQLYMRTSANNGSSYDSGASDYEITNFGAWNTTSGTGNANASYMQVFPSNLGTASNELAHAEVMLYSPSSSQYTYMKSDSVMLDHSGVHYIGVCAGYRASAAAVDAIQFIMSSGNIASGTFKLYGYK
jgi:hypothetical protein